MIAVQILSGLHSVIIAFSALMLLAAGRASGLQKTEWWDAGMVTCLGEVQICMWPS